MRLNNNIGYLLQHTASLLAKQNEQVLQEKLEIGMSQFKILRVLQAKANMTQREIANSLAQTEASISRQIKLMLDDGLLSSTISPTNRREHLIRPTAKGAKITETALEILFQANRPTFESLDEDEQRRLVESLAKIHDQVCTAVHPTMPHQAHPKNF